MPSVIAFQQEWRTAKSLTVRSADQQHFLDLCAMSSIPSTAEGDPTGETYAFEKGVTKSTGGPGFADVCRTLLTYGSSLATVFGKLTWLRTT